MSGIELGLIVLMTVIFGLAYDYGGWVLLIVVVAAWCLFFGRLARRLRLRNDAAGR